MSADELQKSPASSWGAVNDKLREALELIRWSNDSKWQAQCAAEALAADDAARGTMRESERAEWFAVAMNAAACIEDAANCLRDEDAWLAAEGAAKHVREKCNALWQAATRAAAPTRPVDSGSISAALQSLGCERLLDYYMVGPVQRATVEAFADAIAAAPHQPRYRCAACSAPLKAGYACACGSDEAEEVETASPQSAEPVAWLAYDGAHQLFIVGGNGPHDLYGGFPVYLHPAPTEADRLDAQRWRRLTLMPSEANSAGDDSHIAVFVPISAFEFGEEPPSLEAAIDAAMSAQASWKEDSNG